MLCFDMSCHTEKCYFYVCDNVIPYIIYCILMNVLKGRISQFESATYMNIIIYCFGLLICKQIFRATSYLSFYTKNEKLSFYRLPTLVLETL